MPVVLTMIKRAAFGVTLAAILVSAPVSAAPGDTMWIPDIRIEGGVEVRVYKEMMQGENGRWHETGKWAYEADMPFLVDAPQQ